MMSAARIFVRFYFCFIPTIRSLCICIIDTPKSKEKKMKLHSCDECEEILTIRSLGNIYGTGEEKSIVGRKADLGVEIFILVFKMLSLKCPLVALNKNQLYFIDNVSCFNTFKSQAAQLYKNLES